MIEYARNIIDELCRELEERDQKGFGKGSTTRQSLVLIVSATSQVKSRLKEQAFASELEEIDFFKVELPRLISLLVYYVHRDKLESLKAFQMHKQLEQASNALQVIMDEFFKENMEFIRYWSSGSIDRDHVYFLQKEGSTEEIYDPMTGLIDPEIYRAHSVRIAYFLAYERLSRFIKNGYAEKTENLVYESESSGDFIWTGSIADFTELCYALAEMGVFNHGKATKMQIFTRFGRFCGVKVKNPSSVYQKLLFRNKGEASFLESSWAVIRRFNEKNREKRAKKNLARTRFTKE